MKWFEHPRSAVLALAALAGASALSLTAADKKDTKDAPKAAVKKEAAKPAAAGAVFELYKDSAGEYRFRMKDDEGALLAASGKGYKAKPDATRAIDTIKRTAAKAPIDDQSK